MIPHNLADLLANDLTATLHQFNNTIKPSHKHSRTGL